MKTYLCGLALDVVGVLLETASLVCFISLGPAELDRDSVQLGNTRRPLRISSA